jgi:hypothetical protein
MAAGPITTVLVASPLGTLPYFEEDSPASTEWQ